MVLYDVSTRPVQRRGTISYAVEDQSHSCQSVTAQFRTAVWSSKEFDAAGGNFSLIILNFLEPVITARQIHEFRRWEQKQLTVTNISKCNNEFRALCSVSVAYVELV